MDSLIHQRGSDTIFTLIVISLLIFTAIVQVVALNNALKYELPLLVLPLFFTTFSVFSVMNGMVYSDAFGTIR
jgi:hypothetical protein